MSHVHLERTHRLGLPRARQLAREWVDHAERSLEMVCTWVETPDGDTIEFARSGVQGVLRVEADRLMVDAELGFLLGTFRKKIEAGIEEQLDRLLDGEGPE